MAEIKITPEELERIAGNFKTQQEKHKVKLIDLKAILIV